MAGHGPFDLSAVQRHRLGEAGQPKLRFVDQQYAYSFITCEIDRSLLVIALNRPDKLNAYAGAMGSEIEGTFHKAGADDDIRAIMVTGAWPCKEP